MFARFVSVFAVVTALAYGLSTPETRAESVLLTTEPFTFMIGPLAFPDTNVGATSSTFDELEFTAFPNGSFPSGVDAALAGIPATAPVEDLLLFGDTTNFTLVSGQVLFTPQSPGFHAAYVFKRTLVDGIGEVDTYNVYVGTGVAVESQEPVCLTLNRRTGQPKPETLTDIPASLSKATITDGAPGLTNLRIAVNGVEFEAGGLHSGEVRTIDLASAMQPGSNTVVLTALGKPGGKADVCVHE